MDGLLLTDLNWLPAKGSFLTNQVGDGESCYLFFDVANNL